MGGLTFHIINNLNGNFMVELTGPLAKLLKKTKLRILAVDDDSSRNTDLLKVELPEQIRIKGSNPLPNGKDMWWVADNLIVGPEDIKIFNAGIKEITNAKGEVEMWYEGPLKLDVAKPKGSMVNGQWVWRQQPRIWLVSTLFSRRGSDMIQDSQESMRGALNSLFAPPEETQEERDKLTQAGKNTTAAGAAETPAGGAAADGKQATDGKQTADAGVGGNKGRGGANIGG